jgi:hypothetical protein
MTREDRAVLEAAARALTSSGRGDLAGPLRELIRRDRAVRQQRIGDETAAVAHAMRLLDDGDLYALWLGAMRDRPSALTVRVAGWAEQIRQGREPS